MNVFCDNQSAIHLSKNQQFHERTKHIDVKLQFIREIIEKGTVSIVKVKTEDNAANMLTKIVTQTKLEYCLKLLKVTNLPHK